MSTTAILQIIHLRLQRDAERYRATGYKLALNSMEEYGEITRATEVEMAEWIGKAAGLDLAEEIVRNAISTAKGKGDT